jgi:hypothetical protein
MAGTMLEFARAVGQVGHDILVPAPRVSANDALAKAVRSLGPSDVVGISPGASVMSAVSYSA